MARRGENRGKHVFIENMGMPQGTDAASETDMEKKLGAIRTALFVLALSLMVQVVQYLWFY
jgi:hypothetical protein